MDQPSAEYVLQLTRLQPFLYAYILSLIADRVAAQDLLQETNVTLIQKADEFESGTNFAAWASRIANYHVLNYRRKSQRERTVLDEALLVELSERQAQRAEETNRYLDPLRQCLEQLPEDRRALLARRYTAGLSVQQIAEDRGQMVGAVSQMLYRIRETLLDCVTARLRERDA